MKAYIVVTVPPLEKSEEVFIEILNLDDFQRDSLVNNLHEKVFSGELYQYKVKALDEVPKTFMVSTRNRVC